MQEIFNLRHFDGEAFDEFDFGFLLLKTQSGQTVAFSCGDDGFSLSINDPKAVELYEEYQTNSQIAEGFIKSDLPFTIDGFYASRPEEITLYSVEEAEGIFGILIDNKVEQLLIFNGGDNLLIRYMPDIGVELRNFEDLVYRETRLTQP